MRQTTIIVVAAATKKLLFISGFSVFSGFSGLSISKPSPKFRRANRVIRELSRIGRLTGPLMRAEAADSNDVVDRFHRSEGPLSTGNRFARFASQKIRDLHVIISGFRGHLLGRFKVPLVAQPLAPEPRRRSRIGMNLLVIRHAIAEDKERFAATGRKDDLRPLTEEGRSKMRRGAEGLRVVVGRISQLASSPLVRARETAEIVAPALGIPRVEIVEALRPDRSYDELLEWLHGTALPNDDEDRIVGIVGHEPHLSGLVTWLMTGGQESRIELKKGAACLLHFEHTPEEGQATLLWSLAPAQLRELGN